MRFRYRIILVVMTLSFLAGIGLSDPEPGLSDPTPEAEVEEEAAADRTIVFSLLGQVDTQLVDRVATFVGNNYHCPVRTVTRDALKSSPQVEAEDLGGQLGPDDLCVVELISIPEDVGFGQAVFKLHNAALLNIWRLRPGEEPGSEQQDEQYIRRVEKETVQLVALLLGLEICPLPRCALSIWRNEQELDEKARELCPPCRYKAVEILRQKGVDAPEM
jgi:hypothetical protein